MLRQLGRNLKTIWIKKICIGGQIISLKEFNSWLERINELNNAIKIDEDEVTSGWGFHGLDSIKKRYRKTEKKLKTVSIGMNLVNLAQLISG